MGSGTPPLGFSATLARFWGISAQRSLTFSERALMGIRYKSDRGSQELGVLVSERPESPGTGAQAQLRLDRVARKDLGGNGLGQRERGRWDLRRRDRNWPRAARCDVVQSITRIRLGPRSGSAGSRVRRWTRAVLGPRRRGLRRGRSGNACFPGGHRDRLLTGSLLLRGLAARSRGELRNNGSHHGAQVFDRARDAALGRSRSGSSGGKGSRNGKSRNAGTALTTTARGQFVDRRNRGAG